MKHYGCTPGGVFAPNEPYCIEHDERAVGCRVCGKLHVPRVKIFKMCCSMECYTELYLREERRKAERIAAARRKKAQQGKKLIGVCPVCEQEFTKARANRIYCSDVCKKKAQHERKYHET